MKRKPIQEIVSENITKSFRIQYNTDGTFQHIEKGGKTGIYLDTSENRKFGRVGQKYKKDHSDTDSESSVKHFSKKDFTHTEMTNEGKTYTLISSKDKSKPPLFFENGYKISDSNRQSKIWQMFADSSIQNKNFIPKKGQKLIIDMANGPEKVTVSGGFKAGALQDTSLITLDRDLNNPDTFGAPYNITLSKLKKVLQTDKPKPSSKSIGLDDIKVGAKFKNEDGTVFIIDDVGDDDGDIMVRSSLDGGQKGNYRDEINDLLSFLHEEKAEKINEQKFSFTKEGLKDWKFGENKKLSDKEIIQFIEQAGHKPTSDAFQNKIISDMIVGTVRSTGKTKVGFNEVFKKIIR